MAGSMSRQLFLILQNLESYFLTSPCCRVVGFSHVVEVLTHKATNSDLYLAKRSIKQNSLERQSCRKPAQQASLPSADILVT